MDILGRPERSCGFLHVGGTNGKGSVSTMSESILRAAGHRTGLYISPHLVSFTERIKIGGVDVSERDVVDLACRLVGLVANEAPDLKPTFFEFTTAMALDCFRERGVEVGVLEVGMGGRLDSTNVVEPACVVITNVDVEHREYLGDTLMEIAREKAGIMKPGVPVVLSETKPEVIEYMEAEAARLGAPVYLIGRDYGFSNPGLEWTGAGPAQTFDYTGPGGELAGLMVPIAGPHQLANAATAACACALISGRGYAVSPDAMRDGLGSVRWPGRLEIVSGRPLTVFDGAHNPASVAVLAEALRSQFAGRYGKFVLIMGVLDDKDFRAMFEMLSGFADTVIFTRSEYERSLPAAKLMEAAEGSVKKAYVTESVKEALELAASTAAEDDMVLLTGSLYVVGEAKAAVERRSQFLRA
jgi:dihydrofolate synthase/folylpolyglutamate synthase